MHSAGCSIWRASATSRRACRGARRSTSWQTAPTTLRRSPGARARPCHQTFRYRAQVRTLHGCTSRSLVPSCTANACNAIRQATRISSVARARRVPPEVCRDEPPCCVLSCLERRVACAGCVRACRPRRTCSWRSATGGRALCRHPTPTRCADEPPAVMWISGLAFRSVPHHKPCMRATKCRDCCLYRESKTSIT